MLGLFSTVRNVRGRIQAVIAETFGLDPTLMYLTKPTFFSRINSTAAKTQHDEYWHPHIDKVTHKHRVILLWITCRETPIWYIWVVQGDIDFIKQMMYWLNVNTFAFWSSLKCFLGMHFIFPS